MSQQPQTEDETLSEVKDLLDEPYEHAKRAHIWAEEESGEHNWLAMTNFRDALDHMSKIFKSLDDGDIDEARENLGEMDAHIKRAAYDSAQSATEQKLGDVMERRLPSSFYTMSMVSHMGDEEFYNRKDKVPSHLSKGREKKAVGMEESLKEFLSAYQHAKEMARGTPARKEVLFRLIVLIGVLGTIAAVAIAVISL